MIFSENFVTRRATRVPTTACFAQRLTGKTEVFRFGYAHRGFESLSIRYR